MDSENQISLDINSADAEALTGLHGVGGRLAERIIKARPFENIDDLTRVRGISEKDVERLRPFLNFSGAVEQMDEIEDEIIEEEGADPIDEQVSEDEVDETIDEAIVETLENIPEIEANTEDASEETEVELDEVTEADEEAEVVALDDQAEPVLEEIEPIKETPTEVTVSQPDPLTRGGACSLIFIGGLITLILAVVITLGVIASINNGQLNYASPYQVAALQSQTESLSVQANTLAEDISGLRTRIDNLEALSGRVSDVETEVASLQDDLAGLQAEVAATQAQYGELAAQMAEVDEQIEVLTVQGNRYESFLEGLRALMEGLFPENPEVEETP